MAWTNRLIDHTDHVLHHKDVFHENILQFFDTTEEKRKATIEYFLLTHSQQLVLARYLRNPEFGKSCLFCLGFIASCIVKDRDFLEKSTVESAISSCITLYGKKMPVEIDVQQVLTLLSIQHFNEALRMAKNSISPFSLPSRIVTQLCIYAIVNGVSVWSAEKKPSEILVEQKRNLGFYLYDALSVCSPSQMEGLIDEWVNPEPTDVRTDEDYLLFRLLVSCPLSPKGIVRICNRLFKDNSITAMEAMELLQESYANKEAITQYICSKYLESLETGKPEYIYANAVLGVSAEEDQAVPMAMERVSSSQQRDEIITGLATVSLAAWLQVRKHRMRYLTIPFKPTKTFVNKLISLICDTDPSTFNIAVNCTEDLYYLGLFDNHLLDQEPIRAAAISMLQSSDLELQLHAEKLLGIMPLTTQLPSWFRKYRKEYFQHLQGAFKSRTITLFRILAKAHVWSNKERLFKAYRRLYLYAYNHRSELPEEDVASLQLLKFEILEPFKCNFIRETSAVVLEHMRKPLSKDEADCLSTLRERLLADSQMTFTVSSETEVANLLTYTEMHLESGCCEPCVLLERAKILSRDIGSFLILRWFVILCRYSKSENIFSFYKQFPLLNLPAKYTWAPKYRNHNSEFFEYAQFLQAPSRVTAALQLASTETIRFFVNKKEYLPTFVFHEIQNLLVDRLFLNSSYKKESVYHGLLEARDVYETPMEFWELFYDDKGITKIAIANVPQAEKAILFFAYVDDLEIGCLAVQAHPWNFKYLSAQLKQHSDIRKALALRDKEDVL